MLPDETDTELLLTAYIDGELDAASALAFDRRLAADPALTAARDRLLALRGLLRKALPPEPAPDRLRAAMAAQAGANSAGSALASFAARRAALAPQWRTALAACLVGAILGGSLTTLVLPPVAATTAEAVSDHLRAIMAPQPFDVASTDQHTVKPWFTGRLPFAPQVFDLSKAGFDLLGGRVDVMNGQPAAGLVYRHGKHLVSLIAQLSEPVAAPARTEASGFQVRDWITGGMRYWAVSDMAGPELDAFEAAVRAQAAGNG